MPSAVICRLLRASRYLQLDMSSGSLSCIRLRLCRAVALAGMALRLSDTPSVTADRSASASVTQNGYLTVTVLMAKSKFPIQKLKNTSYFSKWKLKITNCFSLFKTVPKSIQTERQTDRKADRQKGRQADSLSLIAYMYAMDIVFIVRLQMLHFSLLWEVNHHNV